MPVAVQDPKNQKEFMVDLKRVYKASNKDLAEAELDPTYVIGGKLNSSATHARLGKGKYLVAEADESDASFLYLQPMIAIVTNVDADHLPGDKSGFIKCKITDK